MGRAPTAAEFAAALGDAVRAVEDAPADWLELDDDLMAAARTLTGHYESDAWTWRR
jgi:hypothetical protein